MTIDHESSPVTSEVLSNQELSILLQTADSIYEKVAEGSGYVGLDCSIDANGVAKVERKGHDASDGEYLLIDRGNKRLAQTDEDPILQLTFRSKGVMSDRELIYTLDAHGVQSSMRSMLSVWHRREGDVSYGVMQGLVLAEQPTPREIANVMYDNMAYLMTLGPKPPKTEERKHRLGTKILHFIFR